MLKFLRKKGVAKKILWVVAIIIIISFGFFGTASVLNNRESRYAGKIFGKKISLNNFQKTYDQVNLQAMLKFGDKFYQMQQYLSLRSAAWDRLILLKIADKKKIRVSDKDVIKAIEKYSFFKKNGTFDPALYERIVEYAFHMKPRKFEEGIRDMLRLGELREQVTQGLSVNEKEILDRYKNQNEKIQVSYVFIDPQKYQDGVSLKEEELKKYYEGHKKDFLIPPQINVEYISLEFPEEPKIENQKNLSDEEKKSLEEKTTKEYEDKKDVVRQKASDIYDEMEKNDESLADAAKKEKIELKTTGLFSMEKPSLVLGGSYELLNNIFQLDVNEVADPFETRKGMIIAKVKEKQDAHIPDYEEAKDRVKETLIKKKSRDIASEQAQKIWKDLSTEIEKTKLKNFAKSAKNLGLEIYQTPVFTRGQYLPKVGISKSFEETAFTLTDKNPLSKVVSTEKGFCILHLDESFPIDKDDFEKKKSALRDKILEEKKDQAFTEFLTQQRLKANLQDNLKKEEDQENL